MISYLGFWTAASGTYTLSGGRLSVGGNEVIGRAGSGEFTQGGGTHTVSGDLHVGDDAGTGLTT